jgi:hypothetical protein
MLKQLFLLLCTICVSHAALIEKGDEPGSYVSLRLSPAPTRPNSPITAADWIFGEKDSRDLPARFAASLQARAERDVLRNLERYRRDIAKLVAHEEALINAVFLLSDVSPYIPLLPTQSGSFGVAAVATVVSDREAFQKELNAAIKRFERKLIQGPRIKASA